MYRNIHDNGRMCGINFMQIFHVDIRHGIDGQYKKRRIERKFELLREPLLESDWKTFCAVNEPGKE